MNAQIALNVVKQMEAIHERASHCLQAYGSGEDSEELLTTLIGLIGGIYIETMDPDLSEAEKAQAFAELMGDVIDDRDRNKKVYFESRLDLERPPYYEYPNLSTEWATNLNTEVPYMPGDEY